MAVVALLALGMLGLAVPDAWSTGATATTLSTKAFRFSSGNIACLYDSGRIRCDIYSGIKPAPAKACKYFWKGAMLDRTGRATWLCIIDSIYDANAPVLARGQTWHRTGLSCIHRVDGLRCRNGLGHGFFLSRAQARKW